MDKLEYIARSLSRGTNKKYETYVINAIYQRINNTNLIIETQKEIKLDNGYRALMDLYLPQFKIAVEVDEGYHSSKEQNAHDIWREDSINNVISRTNIGDFIRFERVKAYNVTLEEINKRIDEIVNMIKEKIINRTEPLVFLSDEERIKDIKKRGYIKRDDYFYTNCEIINIVYGKSLKGWQKAGYKLIWFPVMSMKENGNLTDKNSWQNFFNSSQTIIYERSIRNEVSEKKKKQSILDFQNNKIRIVFAKDKDSFGKFKKRFVGVFKAMGWDDNLNAQIWELVLTKINIPLDEKMLENL